MPAERDEEDEMLEDLEDIDDDDLDDADMDSGGGSFADTNSVFAASGSKNVFAPRGMASERVDPRNPVISREEEQEEMYHVVNDTHSDNDDAVSRQSPGEKATSVPQGGQKHQLKAVFDDHGRPFVARFVDGKQAEPYRPPTHQEALALKSGVRTGRAVVHGGLVGDDAAPAPVTQPSAGIPWKKVFVWGGVAVGVGVAGWWLWKRYMADVNTKVDEVEG